MPFAHIQVRYSQCTPSLKGKSFRLNRQIFTFNIFFPLARRESKTLRGKWLPKIRFSVNFVRNENFILISLGSAVNLQQQKNRDFRLWFRLKWKFCFENRSIRFEGWTNITMIRLMCIMWCTKFFRFLLLFILQKQIALRRKAVFWIFPQLRWSFPPIFFRAGEKMNTKKLFQPKTLPILWRKLFFYIED